MTLFHWSSVISSIEAPSQMPALHTSMSIRPNFSRLPFRDHLRVEKIGNIALYGNGPDALFLTQPYRLSGVCLILQIINDYVGTALGQTDGRRAPYAPRRARNDRALSLEEVTRKLNGDRSFWHMGASIMPELSGHSNHIFSAICGRSASYSSETRCKTPFPCSSIDRFPIRTNNNLGGICNEDEFRHCCGSFACIRRSVAGHERAGKN
jgi:hypothetical protein